MRQLLAPGVSLVLALGLIALPSPQPVSAEPLPAYPKIYTEPYCISTGGPQTITMKGRNFEPNAGLTLLQFGSFTAAPPSVHVVTDAYGVFVVDMGVSVGFTTYGIRVDAYYDSNNESTVTSVYPGGCYTPTSASLDVLTDCGDFDNPGIEVRGTNFGAAGVGGDIRVELTQNEQTVGEPLTINAAERFHETWRPGVQLKYGEYQVVASQSAIGTEFFWNSYDTFLVPCPEATIEPTCVPSTGGPPDRLSILVSGTGWQKGTADGYDELQVVFDPEGEPQEFFFSANPFEGEPGFGDDGSIGPLEINPYARPAGVYTVEVKQQGYGEEPLLDVLLTFNLPCRAPTLTADPDCGPPELIGDAKKRYAVTVTGADFYPDEDVVVVFNPDFVAGSSYPPESFDSVVGADGRFSVTIDAAFRPPGTYQIYAYEQTRIGLFEARTPFLVPCVSPTPTLLIDPTCGAVASTLPLAYTVNISGEGFAPGRVDIVFDPTGTLPEQATAIADDNGFFTATVQLNGRPPGAYLLVASQTSVLGLLDEASVPFPVTCDGAILRITPTSGSRRFVPVVEGYNFAPSTTLYLFWDYGIGSRQPIKVDTDETGSFRRQVVIFRSDFIGPRHLSVQSPDDPLAYAAVLPLDYLVTPTSVSPPFKLDGNPFAAADATIVFRR